MARFTYRIKDAQGKTQSGLVEATSLKHAGNLLHDRGFYIISLNEATPSMFATTFASRTGIGFNDLVHVTRQLSTMITAGLTLVEALDILQQQVKKPAVLQMVVQLEEGVQGGKSFGEVLEKYPKVFPPIYLALVKAGEASGKLDVILSRLADNLEKTRDFRGKVRGALIYPTIVITGMVTVSLIVMTVVVPRLTTLYKEFGVTLPLPTRILIAISTFLIHSWWLMIIIIVASTIGFLKWRQTAIGKHIIAIIILSIPVFGPLIREATLVEVTRTLSILIDSGVPILASLEISKSATANVLYKEAFEEATKMVEKGYPLSAPLQQNKLFPSILGQMVAVGEQTGKVGESLYKLSHYFETEADNAVRSLTTLLEPLIMVVLGLGVGFLVMAVLLPIYSLTSKF